MNRFQSLQDGHHASVLLDLCAEVAKAAPETGQWIINGKKLAFRGNSGEVYDFDFDHDDGFSRAIVTLFNEAHAITRNLTK